MSKEEIRHFKSLLRQGSLRHMNILLDDKFQSELLNIIKDYELLEKENKQLKECYCNRTDCSGRIKNSRNYDSLYQKYNKQLDNWNKLKEYIDTVFQWYSYGNNGPVEAKIAKEILNEVQKLERSDDNVRVEK